MRIGLVLEGGGTRGMYSAGLLDAFLDNDISFDGVVGVSAGALFGVNFLSKQKGRAIRYNKRFNNKLGYMGLIPLLKEGNIVSTEYAYERVPRKLDSFDNDAFKKSQIPFYAVVTNVETGKPEYIHIKDVFKQMDCLRASGSLPFVSKAVKIDNKEYLDGGISDSIPFQWMLDNGYDKIVVILTRSSSYRKKQVPDIILNMCKKKYKEISKAMGNRHIMYNNEVDELRKIQANGIAYVITPDKDIPAGKLEKNEKKLQESYDMGYEDGIKNIEALKMFFKE